MVKRVTQVELHYRDTRLVCWVDRDVNVGQTIRLKHDDRWWVVHEVYSAVDVREINTGWNNNI